MQVYENPASCNSFYKCENGTATAEVRPQEMKRQEQKLKEHKFRISVDIGAGDEQAGVELRMRKSRIIMSGIMYGREK